MRNRAIWPALLLLSLGLAGCGEPEKKPADPAAPAAPRAQGTVGVSLLTLANPFFVEMRDAMAGAAREQGYELVVTAAEMDAARQRDQVKDFIVRKVSAIVLCPADSRAVGTTIREANAAGIPVFTADIACLDPAAKVVAHIATDNLAGGRLAGEAMIEALGGRGKVAIIDHPEVESVLLRTRGFKEAIRKAPGLQLVAQLPGGAQRDTAMKTAEDILEREADLAGIFAINDPTAFGAVAALEKAGRAGKVVVIGFDGMPEAKQAIKAGKIYADPIQHPDRIGRLAIEAVARYRAGETVPPESLIPTDLYRKSDAEKDPSLR
jgi:ribose transport system substrate-binding protein